MGREQPRRLHRKFIRLRLLLFFVAACFFSRNLRKGRSFNAKWSTRQVKVKVTSKSGSLHCSGASTLLRLPAFRES
jgi:hypothetical protein